MHKEHQTRTQACQPEGGLRALPPINEQGDAVEIDRRLGGEEKLAEAIDELQALLYAA